MQNDLYRMKCCGCACEWADHQGQFGVRFVEGCPQCGSKYWEVKELLVSSSVVEQRADNAQVGGPIPLSPTTNED